MWLLALALYASVAACEEDKRWKLHTREEMEELSRDSELWFRRWLFEEMREQALLEVPRGVPKLTERGFVVEQVNAEAWGLIEEFWSSATAGEEWAKGLVDEDIPPEDTYTNHYDVPSKLLPITRPVGKQLVELITLQLANWTGLKAKKLEISHVYGVRVFHEGAMERMHPNRDDIPLGVIINVAQSKPWPLIIRDHQGEDQIVLLNPGELVMYEGGACPHGRPAPLRGEFYAQLEMGYTPRRWKQSVKKYRTEHDIPDPAESTILFEGRPRGDGKGGVSMISIKNRR